MARIRTDNIRRNLDKIIDNSTYRPWTASSEAQTRFGAILDKSGRLLTLKQANAKAVAAGREKFTAGEFGQLAAELQSFNSRVTLRGEKSFQADLLNKHELDVTAHGANLDGLTSEQKKQIFRDADNERKSSGLSSDQFYVIFARRAREKRAALGLEVTSEPSSGSEDIILVQEG